MPITATAVLVAANVTDDSEGHSAETRRAEYVIPHILAADYGSLGSGYG